MNRVLAIAGIVLVAATTGYSQEGPRVVKMTVSPAPPHDPRMHWTLLPDLRELKSGNAAVFYQRSQSLEWWGASMRKAVDEAIETFENPWDAKTLKKLSFSERFGPLLEIDEAARCEYCDWQMLDRLRAEGALLLIPDLQSMRRISALNVVGRIRPAIHQGQFDKAAHALRTQFAMAKHVGEAPMLVSYLVGMAISGAGQDVLEEWVQAPSAPCLYWALTDLPQPLVDSRRPLQSDVLMFEAAIPEIRQALKQAKPDPIPSRVLNERIRRFFNLGGMNYDSAQLALAIASAEPRARSHFAAKNLTNDEIDRLPVTQLVLMFVMEIHDLRTAELFKLQNLPYWQAQPLLKKREKQFERERLESPNVFKFEMMWTPSYSGIFGMRPFLERRFAMLRHVEALRQFAADHQGQWPDTLDEITDMPLPVDPFTGKAFHYRRENQLAILEAFAPPGMAPSAYSSMRYELTLRKENSK